MTGTLLSPGEHMRIKKIWLQGLHVQFSERVYVGLDFCARVLASARAAALGETLIWLESWKNKVGGSHVMPHAAKLVAKDRLSFALETCCCLLPCGSQKASGSICSSGPDTRLGRPNISRHWPLCRDSREGGSQRRKNRHLQKHYFSDHSPSFSKNYPEQRGHLSLVIMKYYKPLFSGGKKVPHWYLGRQRHYNIWP